MGRRSLSKKFWGGGTRNYSFDKPSSHGRELLPKMKLRTLDNLQDRLDQEFGWRIKEIAEIKLALKSSRGLREATLIRAGIPLLYAHWEGFVKSAAEAYIGFIALKRLSLGDLASNFVALAARTYLEELTRSNRTKLHIDAVQFLRTQMASRAELRYNTKINTHSNLNSDVFEDIATTIGIDQARYHSRYNFLDSSLLARRNSIAHGEHLDLDIDAYSDLSDGVVTLLRWVKTDIQNSASLEIFRVVEKGPGPEVSRRVS